MKSLKPVTETKYLSVENAWRYRAIMRIFYHLDQRLKHWVNKEEIYKELKLMDAFFEYTIEQLKQDLDALCEWGNLNAVQDTAKVSTYQQFINKQYRYQMSEYAVEIERMTIRLENLFIEGGSLEPTLLERIKDELKKLPEMADKDEKVLGGWWNQLISDFQRLNQNYQDYIRDWNSVKAEELMKTQHFMLYKEKLVDYLRNFIKELQTHAYDITRIINNYDFNLVETLVERVTDYEMAIPRLDMDAINRKDMHNNISGKYTSLKEFFTGSVASESEVERILTMTNEIIRRITRYAANILEMSSQYSNRKEEYLTIAKLFAQLETMDEAHKLAGNIFGIKGYKHFVGDLVRETENIQSSIYDEAAFELEIKPRVQTYREKLKKTAIVDQTEKKAAMREKILRERKEEDEILMTYLDTGQVVFEDLNDVPEKVRRTLMRWLVKGIREEGGLAVTEHGKRFKLLNPKEKKRCVMVCEDGLMELPAYILEFEVD